MHRNNDMKTLLEQYHYSLERGDKTEALRLARMIDWVSIAPPVKREPASSINYARLPKTGEWDAEGAILARDERRMMLMDLA